MILYRNESKAHNVPSAVPLLMLFDVLMCIIFSIVTVISLVSNKFSIFYLTPIFIGLAVGFFCDSFFNWCIGCKYDIRKDKIIFTYRLNGLGMNAKETRVVISSVDSYKVNSNKQYVLVKGTITKKPPIGKSTVLKSIKLYYDFSLEDSKCLLDKLIDLKEVN